MMNAITPTMARIATIRLTGPFLGCRAAVGSTTGAAARAAGGPLRNRCSSRIATRTNTTAPTPKPIATAANAAVGALCAAPERGDFRGASDEAHQGAEDRRHEAEDTAQTRIAALRR